MTRPQTIPALLGYTEWTFATLRNLGLGTDEMMYVHLTIFGLCGTPR